MIMMSKSSKMSQGFLEKSGGCVGVSFNRVVHNQRKLRYIDICCKRRVVFSNLSALGANVGVPLQSQHAMMMMMMMMMMMKRSSPDQQTSACG